MPPPSTWSTSSNPSLASFTSTSPSAYLRDHPPLRELIAGAIVINPATNLVLILRRAAHDSWPLMWEVPGGCVDHDVDETLVAAAVRELWEESSLRVTRVLRPVGLVPQEDEENQQEKRPKAKRENVYMMDNDSICVFGEETNEVWGKLTVLVEVESCDDVAVDDNEHCAWAWVSEDEAKREVFADGSPLEFVSDGVRRTVLEGFRLWKEEVVAMKN